MKSTRLTRIASIVAVAVVVTALAIVPAWAVSRPAVPDHAFIGAQDLFGMTEVQARAAIVAAATVPKVSVPIAANKTKLTFKHADKFLKVDVEAMLSQAYIATSTAATFTVGPRYTPNTAALQTWVTALAPQVNYGAVNAKRAVKKGLLVIVGSRSGAKLRINAAANAIGDRLVQEALGNHSVKACVLPATGVAPKITAKNIGLTILIGVSSCKLSFYTGATRKYYWPCAPGQPRYPSPIGTFKVVDKVSMPSWHNPGDAWSKGMPSVIGPGPNNPLGTRALYLNYPGIRIHGIPVSENSSLGHRASHGCIRVLRKNIETLYPQVPIGTIVIIVK